MKVLITGAFGHIGSKLIYSLASSKLITHLYCLDNMSTGRYPSLFNINCKSKLKLIEQDLREFNYKNFNFDLVIHLAAMTDAAASVNKREIIMSHNFECTKKSLVLAKENNAKYIFISTTSVYGKQNGVVDEDTTKDQLLPQSPYAECKLKEEELVLKSLKNGEPCYILRFGTIYGTSPGMRFHTAVNKFCWQACHGIPISVWKTAMYQKRPYLDVKDATEFIKFIAEENIKASLYNVVTENLTVFDIITEIKKHRKKISIEYVESEIMNQLSYEVCSKKSKDIGFKYSGSYQNGIKNTLNLFNAWQ